MVKVADIVRRSFAEFIGTFALVFFGCGTRIMVGGDVDNMAAILVVHLAFGLTIAAMIYTMSYISAALFNPAITLGFAVARRFPWKLVLPFWLAQFLGALLASTVHFLIFPAKASVAHYGATTPKISLVAALVIECVLTFFLMYVSMATATDKRFNRASGGLTVGFVIIVSGLFANFLTGGSMNPARSLAPAIFADGEALTSVWIYFVAPLVGACLGAIVYEIVRGGDENAKDILDEFPVSKSPVKPDKLPVLEEK